MKKKKKVAKHARKVWIKNVEDLELDMLRDENQKLRQCLKIFEEWYSVPQTKLVELIKLSRGI